MIETRVQDLKEENDKKSRELNIIIHGVQESDKKAIDDRKKHDQDFAAHLFQDLEVENVAYKALYRLGKIDPNRKRPLKLVMENAKAKDKVVNNLRKLKDNDKYSGISVTDDYTQSERKLIKDKVEEAKIKNNQEGLSSSFVWKVR